MFALLLLTGATPSVAAPTPPCTFTGERSYTRKADLPPGAAAALGFDMAEKGKPFQATDVVTQPRLPSTRFASAVRQGCRLTISYEQGGFAHGWLSKALVHDGHKWVAVAP